MPHEATTPVLRPRNIASPINPNQDYHRNREIDSNRPRQHLLEHGLTREIARWTPCPLAAINPTPHA